MAQFSDYIEQINNIDFADIDWDKVGVWPWPARLFLLLLSVAAILAASYFIFVKDLNVTLEAAAQQETTLKSSFQGKAFQASNLEAYRAQMAEMEESFGALVAQLPSDTEVPGLLEDIDEKGSDSGLEISSIELQSEQAKEFYVELPIQINVRGGYHDLGTFVSGIAGMPRIVTLHDYQIQQVNDSGLLDMTITAKTYRYKMQEN